ncbi:MAG: hypothetical protein JO250_10675 [Armatimonadetes bacterium]|nr:hypothetical protein [Armatimonadota bacterium]
MNKRLLTAMGASILCATALTGAGLAQQAPRQQDDPKQIAAIGMDYQREGVMSQRDYIRLRKITSSVRAAHAISSSDLNWSLALLKRSPSPLAHARVMAMLGLVHPMPATQRKEISSAIAPFLSSKDKLDRLAATRLQRRLQAVKS